MPSGRRIIVAFDRQRRAIREAAVLFSRARGHIVTNSKDVPINFDTSDSIARRYCLLTMSRKYRNGKLNLWSNAFDLSLSREQLISAVLDDFSYKNLTWLLVSGEKIEEVVN
ncbi:hypothetical protein RJT34_20449 [Clitoria ternatea]|uniref:Uncharacterized protein n=1 Tax=Clitoria ternatea TaxID=43366 RepID=A0AAN9IT86_CLITE